MPTKVPVTVPDVDPLAKMTEPPPDETPTQREARLRAEAEAQHVSDTIDEELERQRVAEKKAPRALKVLLLGQSESGKSTTLKNFQIMYDPKAFKAERASWRAVIQLNVVRSIHLILDAMTRAQNASDAHLQLSPELLKLQMRLAPLLQVEQALIRQLTPSGSGESEPTHLSYAERSERSRNIREVAINSATQWKGAFSRLLTGDPDEDADVVEMVDWGNPNDPGVVLNACAQDMVLLWGDPSVQRLLVRQNLRLEEMAGFFLDSLDRVTSPQYVPSDDDILRARLKTLGVSEHRFTMSQGSSIARDWRVFDVGGHRSLVSAWVPYFDDMDAIIFLAPISCFDQVLAEDPKVNRLEDSVNLWISIVSNELLKNTNLILFLNKIDILKAKLASGIRLVDYVVSYANRPNDFENASMYLRKKFGGLLKEKSILPRPFYCHYTAVTDTKSTKKILLDVKDVLMRRNLADAALLT
ncbi:Guanine nucleotide-binding protein G(i) subunit alpha-2 [Hypsizygus marmoreus]|uniref:Guanine nucleotide-binding protein G(I) subunit alpha-2 n=1 Tax=Hypsizygus marmoreus TaxID=39966 RepID=A0A369KHP1_HYPMA|nr:Guanine nucleotide-binding protein G(i) subunit alpha-2 [Hypsizygus marmoreus]